MLRSRFVIQIHTVGNANRAVGLDFEQPRFVASVNCEILKWARRVNVVHDQSTNQSSIHAVLKHIEYLPSLDYRRGIRDICNCQRVRDRIFNCISDRQIVYADCHVELSECFEIQVNASEQSQLISVQFEERRVGTGKGQQVGAQRIVNDIYVRYTNPVGCIRVFLDGVHDVGQAHRSGLVNIRDIDGHCRR